MNVSSVHMNFALLRLRLGVAKSNIYAEILLYPNVPTTTARTPSDLLHNEQGADS